MRPARVLVIGNGEIGRLAASALVEHHFETWMTLRRYKQDVYKRQLLGFGIVTQP